MSGPFVSCFDVATQVGCCDGPVGGKARYWSWDLRDGGETQAQRFLQLWNFLGAYLVENRVDRMFYEAPVPVAVMLNIKEDDETGRSRIVARTSEDTLNFLRGVAAVIQLAAAAHEIPCDSWGVQEARKAVLGRATFPSERVNGKKVSTAKREVMKGCRLLGHEPDNDNEADAIVGWHFECALLNPRLAQAFARDGTRSLFRF